MNTFSLRGWGQLRHGGLLLDPPRLQVVSDRRPSPLSEYSQQELRRQATALLDSDGDSMAFVTYVLERVCGFDSATGTWLRGTNVASEWSRRTLSGENIKPRQLWLGANDAILPVFIDDAKQLGVGRSRRTASLVVQWLRAGNTRLALLTNGRQWRLIFAGLDFDAWCEWDVNLWFEEGVLSSQVEALRTLIAPVQLTPSTADQHAPLLSAILDSRKGQAELSSALGERVREAVEILVQAHGDALREKCGDVDGAEIYRAAVRVVMRMVVVMFAEARDLLPRDNALYHGAYGLNGLLEELEKAAARGGNRLSRSFSAWPRVLALFRLVNQGSHHPALPVPAYGGELFAPGKGTDGLSRALHVFESEVFDTSRAAFADRDVLSMLEKISRTRVRMRQGRQSTLVTVPVDFSDLSSEYIGILYEGLLDFELKPAHSNDPVIFLAVGNQPALPLSRLEAMEDKDLKALLENMKDTSSKEDGEAQEDAAESDSEDVYAEEPEDDSGIADHEDENDEVKETNGDADSSDGPDDDRRTTRSRAEQWARRAVEVGKLVKKPSAKAKAEQHRMYEENVARKARQLVTRVVLPGEWYLVRWGGTRKGSGTFYTRPGLAVPTIHRTLRPLAYTPPTSVEGGLDTSAPAHAWIPKLPEEILALKTCDPACGSGTFPVGALRFLTDALYAAVHHHGRVADLGDQSMVSLLDAKLEAESDVADLGREMIPCRADDSTFESRLKAILKRHVVERCIYGVDLDPLAVELCRLSLWIETMDRSLPFSFLDHKIKCGNGLVGAWFDQFLHYPVMAWKNREDGDKGHTNGVHYEKVARGKALKEFASGRLKDDLKQFLSGPTLFDPTDRAQEANAVHADALALLMRLHDLPVHDAAERARIYREELLGSAAYKRLKSAMDLWCSCWFWPADALDFAPLPTTFAQPSNDTLAEASRIAAQQRFFHWELEFPDVFRSLGSGFDCILGNPPWDIAKPNSKEFFSNIDPLYRTYGKQEALRIQSTYFEYKVLEQRWLDYNADFRAQSNFMKYAAQPFGDPTTVEGSDRFVIAKGKENDTLHARWRALRRKTAGYADPQHPFRHQGSADINLYKTFLEQAHALLTECGRMGFVIPSGLYSDHGTGSLRRLFLDNCSWEWLFGFENREGIFDIHRSFKFNPIIIQKGGSTAVINTAFMRRKLEDWENAEEHATPYTRAQVDQFSPNSQAILEIQSKRDLEILEKIYANSVLLGDDGPDGWGVKYSTEFHMTNDSHLFPPRTKWEEKGYRPDEYSRWLLGDWRPITELWPKLGINPDKVVPNAVELEEWLFDTSAGPERRTAEARFVHGHLLKPGDVARTQWRARCAQPPYDTLPIPRADIPVGIVLSRNADAYIHEDKVEEVALPLYQGVMINALQNNVAQYMGGFGHRARWTRYNEFNDCVNPQFLLAVENLPEQKPETSIVFRSLARSTDERTCICSVVDKVPCGNSLGLLSPSKGRIDTLTGACLSSSFVFDWALRRRIAGTNINSFFLWESAWPVIVNVDESLAHSSISVAFASRRFAVTWIQLTKRAPSKPWRGYWSLKSHELQQRRITLDAIAAAKYSLSTVDLKHVLAGCDLAMNPRSDALQVSQLDPRGFWRVDKDKDPELRHTVLTLIAFHDLEQNIQEHGGDRDKGIEAFMNQNNGEGWLIPETVRLADYGLGHDERAQHHQPVASRLGPRFYDWQLTQTAEESWRECHLHARNMLGAEGYKRLLEDIEAERNGTKVVREAPATHAATSTEKHQRSLFD
jgi:hypothetical protein